MTVAASSTSDSQPAAAPSAPAPADKPALSPAMRQYQQFKAQYPGYVLFFRMGDFYEMFWEDAQLAAKTLGVTLTSRSRGGLGAEDAIPMAGVPFHAVEGYLRKMIAAGHRVAICEQTEDASQAKGVIQREVVRLMTPGTLTDDPLLDGTADNFLAALGVGITKADGYRTGLCWVELSTGACVAASGVEDDILDELVRLAPAEVLVQELPSGQPHDLAAKLQARGIRAVTVRPGWQFTQHHSREQLQHQWQARSAAGFGFADDDPAVFATAAVLSYLRETQKSASAHIRPLRRHVLEAHLSIDPASWRSLEVDRTMRAGTEEGSLLKAIERTRTPMGSRLLRQWLRTPLRDIEHIAARQSAVASFLDSPGVLRALGASLKDVCDVERIVGRISLGRAAPRDMAALSKCLAAMPALIDQLESLARASEVCPEFASLRSFCQTQSAYLAGAVKPDPAPHCAKEA